MKTEDIDKRIGMPDVDAEWARFEQEVIGKEPKTNKRSIYSWMGGLGIAACLLLFFLINIGDEPQPETPVVAEQAEPQPVQQSAAAEVKEIQKEPIVHIVNTPQPKKTPRKELASANLAFESVNQALQGQIAGLDVVPNPSNLGKGVTMRLRGMTTIDDSIQPLVVLNGKILEIPDSVKIGNYDTEEQFSSLLGVKPEDIKSIVVIKDSKETAKWGEKGANGVIEISTNTIGNTKKVPETKPISEDEQPLLAHSDSEDTGHGPSVPECFLNLSEDELKGQIAGLPPIDIRRVKNDYRRTINKQAPDTILTLVNGKEDEAFRQYLHKMPYWSRTFIYDYFFERNQLFIRQYRPEGDEINKYAHLFNGRDIRFILDYQSRPYKPVGQFTPDELKARRLAYLLRCYQEGENSRNYGGMLAPDLFDTPAEERLFGLLGVKYWQGNRFERFGHVSRDSRGTYIPLERHMQFKVQDQIWEENGEWLGMEDDERFNAVIKELDEAANGASSSLVEPGDSVVAMAFIYGGKVAKGALHESDVMWEKPFKDKVKGSIFEFTPDEDAPSYWTAEIYYSTQFPRYMVVYLNSVDKLYATECPDILNIRYKRLSGVVQNEEGKPVSGALVSYRDRPYFSDGVSADSLGRFELMLPNRIDTIRASWIGYQTQKIHVLPTDSVLTIRLKEIDWKGLRESFKKSKK